MIRSGVAVVTMAALLVVSGVRLLSADEKDAPRGARALPANWAKLGLSDEQKQKIYKAQDTYRTQIAALQKKIRDLQSQEKADLEKVLTDAQKARLREILTGKAPAEGNSKKTN